MRIVTIQYHFYDENGKEKIKNSGLTKKVDDHETKEKEKIDGNDNYGMMLVWTW